MKTGVSEFERLYSLMMESVVNGSHDTLRFKDNEIDRGEFSERIRKFFNILIQKIKGDEAFLSDDGSGADARDAIDDEVKLQDNPLNAVIRCPNGIRRKIINGEMPIKKCLSAMIAAGIPDKLGFKLHKASGQTPPYSEIESSADCVEYAASRNSSVGMYNIPIVVKSESGSDKGQDDIYAFTLKLLAKPNDGRNGFRSGNLSITVCEFIPVMLWNLKRGEKVSGASEVVDLIRKERSLCDERVAGVSVSESSGTGKKLNYLKGYFTDGYKEDDSEADINGKIYGAINVYNYLCEHYAREYRGSCIWTDIKSAKPDSLKGSPADIMIRKADGSEDWLQVSLKSVNSPKQKPPIHNMTIKSFFERFLNKATEKQYSVKKDIFRPSLAAVRADGSVDSNKVDKLMELADSDDNQRTVASNIRKLINGEDFDSFGLSDEERNSIRTHVIELICNIITENFEGDYQPLVNFLLQADETNRLVVLKTVESKDADVSVINTGVTVSDKLKVEPGDYSFTLKDVNADENGQFNDIKVEVRTAGHGIPAYFNYEMVVKEA